MNTTAAKDHVGEIGHGIRVIKEPDIIVIYESTIFITLQTSSDNLIYFVVLWLNDLPYR